MSTWGFRWDIYIYYVKIYFWNLYLETPGENKGSHMHTWGH
jgi:hypothetical protein